MKNRFKLMRGDCLKRMKEIPDNSVDFILCDLPYGMTQNKWDVVIPFDDLWQQYNRILKTSGVVVLCASKPFDALAVASNKKAFKYEWIWEKENGTGFLNAKKCPLKNHENLLVFYYKKPIYNPQMRMGFKPYSVTSKAGSKNYSTHKANYTVNNGSRYPISVLKIHRDKKNVHPTQKPVALCEYLIKTYTNKGNIVLDNCMGSGTTGVAALNLKRKFIGIEKDKAYYKIARKRIRESLKLT